MSVKFCGITGGERMAEMIDRDRWSRLGFGLHAAKRWGAAAACFARALGSGDPQFEGMVLTNLGWNLHLTGRHNEGWRHLGDAIEGPMMAEGGPRALLAQIMLVTGEDDDLALAMAQRGVELAPELPLAHMSRAFAAGMCGRWDECWRAYEWRFRYRADLYGARGVMGAPLWRGEKVSRLWVECEMGLGDTIFGLRWLEAAAARVESVVLHIQPELRAWAAAMFSGLDEDRIEIQATPRPVPEGVDAWCPVMSLPVALEMPGPFEWSWVGPADAVVAPRKVGICWGGNPAHEQSHNRDCPLPYWIRLAENPHIELHSLQVGGSQQLAELGLLDLVRDRAPDITNFADTAAIVGDLDLVITVDTAVAHLAGTLGVPTWLLVNQRGADFRWGRETRTPWYPSVRIFRRRLDQDWSDLMERVGLMIESPTLTFNGG
jgi:hypothetical protein